MDLQQGYETLREAVLSSAGLTSGGGGVAIFVQQGMAAWMKVYALLLEPPPRIEHARATNELVPEGLVEEITSLLATLLLQRKECYR